VRLQQNLRKKYKENDRDWLRNFAEVTVPRMASEFRELYELQDKLWHTDQKTFAFEKVANNYAAAIFRIEYAGRQVSAYLNGEITEIEALEQEPLQGEKQQFLSVERVMNTLSI